MTFGLTPTGFVPKTLSDIKAELEAAYRTSFGASVDLSAKTVYGQQIGIMSERFAELWEVAQGVHSAFNPDEATGDSLEGVAAITGTIREPAAKSEVTITATGTPGTVLALGREASVVSVGTRFITLAAATILAVPAWAASTAYTLGQRVTNGGKVYQVITAGTSAGSGGPTGTGADITDGTVHWRHLGSGTGAIDVAAEAKETGPKVATSGTLTVIETPVSGWSSVINVLDATVGADIETDAALRVRREEELAAGAKATLEAIKTGVLKVSGVTACVVFENVTMVTDVDGVPPKAVEVLVLGGADADVRKAVFEHVAGGIESHGSNSGSVVDSSGNNHTVKFSRPTEKTVYIVADVVKDASVFPADGETQIKNKLKAYGDTYPIGKDVIAHALRAQIFAITGVLNVTNCFIGTAPAPGTEATITCNSRERAVFDTSRITVNLSNGTP